MAIRKITSKRKKQGWRYDSKTGEYYSYRADYRVGGRRMRDTGFPTIRDAERFLDAVKMNQKYRKRGLPVASDAPTVAEVFQRRLEQIENRREKKRSLRVLQYFLDLFERKLKISDVRKSHFQMFVNARLADGVKPETVNREINCLSPCFTRANEMFPEQLGGYEPPPVARARVSGRKRPKKIITETEKNRIVAFLSGERAAGESRAAYRARVRVARIFEIGWLLGLRLGEILKLEKGDFNPDEKRLRVVRWKTGDISQIEYLPDSVCALLAAAIRDSATDYIFTVNGSMPCGFYLLLKRAVESAGLRYGRGKPDGITFHSTRHSFVTRLIQITDLATAQSYTGHSTKEMLGYYGHATDDSRRKAMQGLFGDGEQNLETIG